MNNVYEYIIVGGGPWGLTVLKELYNNYSQKVLCIEKGNQICYNLKNFFPHLVMHSKSLTCSIYPENKLLLKRDDEKVYVNELISSYIEIFDDLPIELNTEMLEIKTEKNLCVLVVSKKGVNKELYCKKVILAHGCFDFKNIINFNYTNSKVYYNFKDPEPHYKNIACIGGGFSSIDVAQYLSEKNISVDIFFRNKINREIEKSKKKYKGYNANFDIINQIKYKSINKIDNNIIYFDGKNKKYDMIFILIGFNMKQAKNEYLNSELKKYVNEKIFFIGSIINDDIMSLHDKKSIKPPFSQEYLKKIIKNITNSKIN